MCALVCRIVIPDAIGNPGKLPFLTSELSKASSEFRKREKKAFASGSTTELSRSNNCAAFFGSAGVICYKSFFAPDVHNNISNSDSLSFGFTFKSLRISKTRAFSVTWFSSGVELVLLIAIFS